MPFTIKSLAGRPNFPTTVRLVRILFTLLRRHMSILPSESGDALAILTHLLDQDTMMWKRALCMEVFRGIFAEPALLRRIYMLYDGKAGEKDILKSLTATFVRVSTERPSTMDSATSQRFQLQTRTAISVDRLTRLCSKLAASAASSVVRSALRDRTPALARSGVLYACPASIN